MREILFRGMNHKRKWVYGCFIHTGVDAPAIIFGDGEQEEIIPETLGQYIGLKDKKQVKIFEGDIVNFGTGRKRIVNWDDQNATFCFSSVLMTPIFRIGDINEFEIIGNIHDNI